MTIITQESCHSVVQVHDNVEAVKLYSKVDGGTAPFPFLPPLSIIPLEDRSGPLNPAGRSVDSDVARVWKGVHEKRDLPETFHKRHTRGFGGESGGPPFSQKKNEFGIGGGAISACIEGSLAFFSLFLVDILLRSEFLPAPPTPPHRISMQISTNCETHIFKKWRIPKTSRGSASAEGTL